jgi:hypothetical protein
MSAGFGQPVGVPGFECCRLAVISSMLSSASTGVWPTRIGLGRILASTTGLYALRHIGTVSGARVWVFIVADRSGVGHSALPS